MNLPESNNEKTSVPESSDDDDILKELCVNNGLTVENLNLEGASCEQLEMFFSGYPRMIGLHNFPNLQELVIMGQTVNKIDGLSSLIHLKELWIAECCLKKIEGLDSLYSLTKLYLYSNRIEQIEKLDKLQKLEILWLNDNEISTVQGLQNLINLREVNLAENSIEVLDESLNGLSKMSKLELSGNQIRSFTVLSSLARLASLKELGLKTPTYNANPIGILCNYLVQVLYHLPQLHMLDGIDVTSKAIRDNIETTVEKKKMYYHMKMKTLYRNLDEMLKRAVLMRKQILKSPHLRIRTLASASKQIEFAVNELKREDEIKPSVNEADTQIANQSSDVVMNIPNLRAKQKAIKDKIKILEKKCAEVEYHYTEGMKRMRLAVEHTVQRLYIELQSGGNIRFQDGLASDPWFSSCHDLLLSRFCASDYKELGISGIKVHRITRVHNRSLCNRFDEAITAQIDDEEECLSFAKNLLQKNMLEYLFWISDAEISEDQSETHRILREGFPSSDLYKQLGLPEAVPLSNCLYLADKPRMERLSTQVLGLRFADTCPYRFGQVVVCKTFIGKSTTCADHQPIDCFTYPLFDSVYRQKQKIYPQTGSKCCCECSERQSLWYIFDHELIVPEYVIDFEYLTQLPPISPFLCHEISLLERRQKPMCVIDETVVDDDVLLLPPIIKPRPKLIELPHEMLLDMAKVNCISNIRVLNLHGNCLTSLKCLSGLTSLRRLVVSFNELTRLDDLSHMSLESLDASFNQICTLEGFKSMNCMKHLDLSWNRLSNCREDIAILRKHSPLLTTLDLQHNPWRKPEGMRLRVIGRLKTLTRLNEMLVTDAEVTAAVRIAAASRISQMSLLSCSRIDTSRPRTMSLDSCTHSVFKQSLNRPERNCDTDISWLSKVTCLNMDNQHISKLSNLEQLTNLRWASFNHNHIMKIEGLDMCCYLEELSLEHNALTRFEGLLKLSCLKRLHLGHNYISSIDVSQFDRVSALQYLGLESNNLTSLLGLQRAVNLTELYLGDNDIQSVRDIYFLKNTASLMILDLFGNPIMFSMPNYRLFIIFHLKALKALDGKSIEASEISFAKDTFGGRLTQDFVVERLSTAEFNEIKELDFPQSGIRSVDLGNGDLFLNLRSINLENNSLSSFSGLIHLMNVRVLCLNHNHIESIVARPKQINVTIGKNRPMPAGCSQLSTDAFTMPSLEVLHLGYNGIKDMSMLQLHRLPSLKALFLQGNEIVRVEGLEGLHDLRELVLDRNKIKSINEMSFVSQLHLLELHLEENRMRDLSHVGQLPQLQRLFLGMNRLQDLVELQKIETLTKLLEISVVSNVVSRRMLHRPMLIFRMPQLQVIDGIAISEEERSKVDMYFMDMQAPPINTSVENILPGINNGCKGHMAMKVTNVQLNSGMYYDDSVGQADLQRGAGRRRVHKGEPLQSLTRSKVSSPVSGLFTTTSGSKSVPTLPNPPTYAYQTHDYENSTENSRLSKTPKR